MSRMNIAIDAFEGGIARTAQRPALSALSALWRAVAAPANGIVAAYAERRRINRAVAELAALSDHVLADIGIARHDIERIVRNGRDAVDRHA
ncbi:MAG TPA: DUF1127 domain-containing protein [Hyphomicrobiaceae bacterium]|nr:DUF1127 domain-containing protein [Hyphomicrobiaceae bacterium]